MKEISLPRGGSISRSSHPEAARPTRVFVVRVERRFEQIRVIQMHEACSPKHLELAVESQESLKQVLFRKETAPPHDQCFRVVGWKKNIVYMNDDARVQIWKYFQKFVLNIS